jgi:hypothetical protein
MALKPETIARLQGILDGTIKVDTTPRPPADLSKLSDASRSRILALLDEPLPATPVAPMVYEDEESIVQDEPDTQELSGADEIIEVLKEKGHGDYTAFRREIALDIYANGHYAGNDTAHFNPDKYDETSTLPGFYVIQEDHYDQHMDEDEDKPSWDSMVAMVQNGYLWTN